VAAASLLAAVVLFWGAAPAGATSRGGLCNVLPTLCPTTTVPKTTTTKAAPPTTAKPVAATTHPSAAATTTTTVKHTTVQQPAIGASGVPAPVDLPALGGDQTAPALANSATASTAPVVFAPLPVPGLVGSAAGTAAGLPDDHSAVRIAFALLVLVIAGVAIGQLPASRRSPRPTRPVS
jgi:hypothetical protein